MKYLHDSFHNLCISNCLNMIIWPSVLDTVKRYLIEQNIVMWMEVHGDCSIRVFHLICKAKILKRCADCQTASKNSCLPKKRCGKQEIKINNHVMAWSWTVYWVTWTVYWLTWFWLNCLLGDLTLTELSTRLNCLLGWTVYWAELSTGWLDCNWTVHCLTWFWLNCLLGDLALAELSTGWLNCFI